MDEPTNDLDIETLELLEELLGAYQGTLLLVSHDREFIDNVVSSTLVLEGNGRVGEFVGGYSDWLRQRPQTATAKAPSPESKPPPTRADAAPQPETAKRKLSYKDARELEQLPARIEALESELAQRTQAMQSADFFKRDGAAITAANQQLAALQTELDSAYARWQELDG